MLWFLRQFQTGRVFNLNEKNNIRSAYQRKYKNVGIFHKVTCSGRKHFISKRNYTQELHPGITVLNNLIDRVTQHAFGDTNFGQSCSKKEIWFTFNCQTKRAIVALFIYPEIPPCRVFFWARWSNICLFGQWHNPVQFPHNHRFYCTICLPKPAQISFFFPPPSEGLLLVSFW